jgi:hypothetical protein
LRKDERGREIPGRGESRSKDGLIRAHAKAGYGGGHWQFGNTH